MVQEEEAGVKGVYGIVEMTDHSRSVSTWRRSFENKRKGRTTERFGGLGVSASYAVLDVHTGVELIIAKAALEGPVDRCVVGGGVVVAADTVENVLWRKSVKIEEKTTARQTASKGGER